MGGLKSKVVMDSITSEYETTYNDADLHRELVVKDRVADVISKEQAKQVEQSKKDKAD